MNKEDNYYLYRLMPVKGPFEMKTKRTTYRSDEYKKVDLFNLTDVISPNIVKVDDCFILS